MSAVTIDRVDAGLTALRAAAGERGIPKRDLFALAKETAELSPHEVEVLLDRDDPDARVVAVSIMDFQARRRRLDPRRRRELFELYLGRHDRIDSWDLVDRAAPYVVGGYLADRPRDPLYRLAASPHWYERRTAIVATYFFIRRGELDDTFAIGDLLAHDPHDLVQKAVGGWTREAGKRDRGRLLAFLNRHAVTMPRVALRYAVEHLEPELRQHYLGLARGAAEPR
ncbi:DNA alkylation repair protein [Pseudonocardia sp. C8]|uniref:DNA alkylation repair protein n=1 Tax=Pseudonocardia sp. C8 TaxID=2762759 RepID=UPI0016425319|nr:DNA alkylation repair protein [Pseudonocardia sp. C8]MBC3191351.1 DNA alkylation repair protein [Pseudonocardia sp. C8]